MSQFFQRILLATERTEFDTGAERLALAMALRCGRPLAVVMPLVSNPEYEAVAPELAARADRLAAASLAQLREQADGAGIVIELQVRHGAEAWREIVDEARERAAELIVIRRRGRRGFLARLLLGEMVSKVVGHAPCSVLIAPREARIWTQCVLAPIDPQAPDTRVVALAAAVARDCELPLTVVAVASVDTPQARHEAEATLEQAVRAADAAGMRAEAQLRFGRAHEQILAAAGTTGAGLIVMGRDGETRPGRAWLGGVTQSVVGSTQLPVLVAVFPNVMESAAT